MKNTPVWLLAAALVLAGEVLGRGQFMVPPAPAISPYTAAAGSREADSSVPAPRAAARGKQVYASAFEKESGPQWSKKQITTCPSGRRTFLGRFGYENTTLSLDNLPEHARVRLSFDMLVILTWDGDAHLENPDGMGPDLFDVTVDHGPRLVHSTFVARPSSETFTQSFPGRFPYDHFPAGSAAAEGRSLGYHYAGAGGEAHPDDYVYHIERSFAHSGKSLKIAFSGINLQPIDDECWGLDNVRVEVLPPREGRELEDAAFARLWTDLGSADPKKFVPAIDAMIDLGEPGVATIRRRLAPRAADPGQDKRIAEWIEQLDADAYMVREKATEALQDMGAAAEPALRAARKTTMSLEVRVRIDTLLARLQPGAVENEEGRRLRRAAEVLELIGGQQARAALAEIAGRTGTLAAWEAGAAIQRLDGKAEIPTKLDLPPGLH